MHGFFARRSPVLPSKPSAPQSSISSKSASTLTQTPAAQNPAAPRPHTRVGDRFGALLREVLGGQRYEVLEHVQLRDVLTLSYSPQNPGGVLAREERRRVDFLIVTPAPHTPVLALSLSGGSYGRDRRRRPEATKSEHTGSSIVSVLDLDPAALQDADSLRRVLQPHLG